MNPLAWLFATPLGDAVNQIVVLPALLYVVRWAFFDRKGPRLLSLLIKQKDTK